MTERVNECSSGGLYPHLIIKHIIMQIFIAQGPSLKQEVTRAGHDQEAWRTVTEVAEALYPFN